MSHFLFVGWTLQDAGNDGEGYNTGGQLRTASLADVAHAVTPTTDQEPQPLLALDDAGTGVAAFDYLAPTNSLGIPDGQLLSATGSLAGPAVHLNGADAGTSAAIGGDPGSGVATVVFVAPLGPATWWRARDGSWSHRCAPHRPSAAFTAGPVAVPLSCTGVGINGVRIAGLPAHGTVHVSGLSVTYTPKPGFPGSDMFALEGVNDGGASPARVTVTGDAAPVIRSFKFRGATFALRLSKPARVTVTVGRFRLESRRLAKSVKLELSATRVRVLSRRGRLRAVASAVDAAGTASSPATLRLRVRR